MGQRRVLVCVSPLPLQHLHSSSGVVHGCLKPKLETCAENGDIMIEHSTRDRRNWGISKEFVSINVSN